MTIFTYTYSNIGVISKKRRLKTSTAKSFWDALWRDRDRAANANGPRRRKSTLNVGENGQKSEHNDFYKTVDKSSHVCVLLEH
jgi:hypothetical protein